MSERIGPAIKRPDALGKVTGVTRYPADLVRSHMLQMQVVFSHRPHAHIISIDVSTARQYPGVVSVFTASDIPYNRYGLISDDQPILCDDKVRFSGDKVALVVAKTKQAAIEGARRVVVEYEDLPSVLDPEKALDRAASLVHSENGSNLLLHFPIRKGDVTQALQEADVVIDETFTTTWQEHAFLQPEAGVAYIDGQGRIVVETAGQWLHEDRRQLARMLRLPEEQIIVRYAAIGGAFGGREDLSVQHLLALAAWKLRSPVALVWSREESMIAHHKRHPVRIQCRWGALSDGTIIAVQANILADGGAYASTSVEVIKDIAFFASGTYEVPNILVDGYVVYTNNIPSGAFRGFGAPQAQFASEIMVTRLAEALNISPIEIRRKNLYREGSIEPTHQSLPEGVSAVPVFERCLEEVRNRWGYSEHNLPSASSTHGQDYLRRGLGIACGIKNLGYSFGFPEQATATVELYGEADLERATVRTGAADVGQGSHLILRQIAAEALNLPVAAISMICDDSSQAPNAGSASASRLTLMAGRAVKEAALAALAKWRDTDDAYVKATYQYYAPATTAIHSQTHSGRPHYCYGYASQAVEVEVNTLTGQVKVLRVISVHDVGKAINIQQVTGQIEGCLAQALGYALLENFQINQQGQVTTPHFSTYLLPTILDMPDEITPVILELADPEGPYGARGVAEMPLVPFAAAVSSAIHNALGIWLTQQPMTPERVLTAIIHKRQPVVEETVVAE